MNILPAAVAVVAAEEAAEQEAAAQGAAVAGGVLALLNAAPLVGHGNIVVHGFTIEGVDDVTPEVRQHVVQFYNQIVPLMMRAPQSYRLYPKVKFELLTSALMRYRDGETLISLKKDYPQIYKWHKAYAVVVNEGSVVLVVRPTNVEFETVDVTTLKQMTFFERAYSDIQRHHVTDHSKGRTLHARISEVIDNIPRDVCKIYTDSCLLCI